MSTRLKPWTKAAFELIVHAELHLRDGDDFDRRIAHICFDNAIEVAITTYLGLNPIQRSNRTYRREDIEQWKSNYHTKLEFLRQEAERRGWTLRIPNDEVVFYHSIRNDQYHAAGGVPESDHIAALRAAALDTFAMLFEIADVEQVLEESLQQRLPMADAPQPRNPTVDRLLDMADEPVVVAGQPYAVSEALYAIDPRAYEDTVAAVMESRNIVDELDERYAGCVRPTIRHAGFVHFEQNVYLKTVDSDGRVELTNTDFVYSGEDERTFSLDHSPDENADLLLHQFDPFSMINCFNLFTHEAEQRISSSHQVGTLESLFQPEQEGGTA
ncbi:MAG: hypothetical protein ABFD83_05580 [Armatimonadota bacterium]